MAKNIIMSYGPIVAMPVTSPTTVSATPVPASGAPCAAGSIVGVAEANVDAVTELTTINTNCIAEVPVLGNDGGGSAVVVDDLLYIGSTGVVSKINTGKKFGTAFGAAQGANTLAVTRSGTLVQSGATTTIQVWVGNFAR